MISYEYGIQVVSLMCSGGRDNDLDDYGNGMIRISTNPLLLGKLD